MPPVCRDWRWESGSVSISLRSPDLVASLLACLRLGLTFVPLEPDFPVERLQGIARQARLSAVICDGHGDVPVFGCPLRSLAGLGHVGEAAVQWPNVDDALAAYMMFTSGSTGEPKGVVISRRALLCFLDGIRERLGLSPNCHWLFITTRPSTSRCWRCWARSGVVAG